MGNALEIVALSVGEVVHRVHFPFRACAVVRVRSYDAVHYRVAEVHIAVSHINLGAEHHGAVGKLAAVHTLEKVKALLGRAVAVRAVGARSGRRPLLAGNLFGRLFVDVGLSFADETYGKVVELLEVVRRIVEVFPLVAEPFNVFLYRVDIFNVLLHGVRVVETQVADAAETFGNSEVHTYGLCVANVQVSVRFRREACLHAAVVHALAHVVVYYLLYEIHTAFWRIFFVYCSHITPNLGL